MVRTVGMVMSVGWSEGWSDSLSNPTDSVHISVRSVRMVRMVRTVMSVRWSEG